MLQQELWVQMSIVVLFMFKEKGKQKNPDTAAKPVGRVCTEDCSLYLKTDKGLNCTAQIQTGISSKFNVTLNWSL